MPSRTFCGLCQFVKRRRPCPPESIGLVVQERVGGLKNATLAGARLPRWRGPVDPVSRRGGMRRGSIAVALCPRYICRPDCLRGAPYPTLPYEKLKRNHFAREAEGRPYMLHTSIRSPNLGRVDIVISAENFFF